MARIKDLKGLKFGHLTVVEMVGQTKSSAAIWRCLCDCGQYHDYPQYTLAKAKHPTACPECTKDAHNRKLTKNLTGQIFGDLEVIGVEKDNNGHYKQLCKCCCGNQKLVKTNDLLNNKIISCGCRSPIKVAKSKSKIKAGQKFGRWTVLEYSSKHHRWKCICECGNEGYVSSHSLKHGRSKSCGCWSAELYREKRLEDLSGLKFGRLTVLQRVEDYICPSGTIMIMWLCECECGEHVKVRGCDLRSGHQLSCRCMKSKGELLIKDFLIKNNIEFKKQKTFDGLRGVGNGKLSYDFYLPQHNLLIEFQGIQHYQINERFGGEEQFERQIEHDKRKRDFAANCGIDLIEISHDQIDDIETILSRKILLSNPDYSGGWITDFN